MATARGTRPITTKKGTVRTVRTATQRRTAPLRRPEAGSMVVPTTMKAAVIDRFGGAVELVLREMPVPRPGPNGVLIAVHAAGVGVWDPRVREGEWAEAGARFPMILGSDGAGIVVARGSSVRRLAIGDRVYAFQMDAGKGGFYAEYAAVDARCAAPIPRPLGMMQAGAAAATGLTAVQGIEDHLHVRKDDVVLIFGGSGAVGTLAIQMAKRKRAHVIATATGRIATKLVQDLGADAVLDARRIDYEDALRGLAPDGIDAILALAGGDALDISLYLLRKGGRIAYPHGVQPEPRRRPGARILAYDAKAGPREFQKLARAFEDMSTAVPIGGIFPLRQASRAHLRVERGRVPGRIVLRIRNLVE